LSARGAHSGSPINRDGVKGYQRTTRDSGKGDSKMFIAMNRFRVKRGSEETFEKVWMNRDSYLDRVPGFVEFHLLKGPETEDHTLYASHTVWQRKSSFENWTRSEEFRAAHARAGNETTGPLYLEHPKFEGFEVRQTVKPKAAVA
jgi:heme-degrading monooxygenase HmoA